ncbi:hypothetical protein [Ramlibacter sp. Leaf400]|uniref:hypothetical protein n=1 Tax=Ramlibacter sp. Leaf400 TaxID=1736365 RepID=UPI0006FA46F8|nr:hypothetical protein [Ramlibacter sp. Leaf400]KQT10967.1 hypothetical protein ASG30_09215 [Ramlibacter sp. Leaf400]
MATSKHLAIRAAVAALFAAGTPVSAHVFQNRGFSLAQGLASQVHVNFDGGAPAEDEVYQNHPIDWESRFELRFLARAGGGLEAHDVADALWTDAYARIMADRKLGGLVWDLTPADVDVDTDEADTSVAVVIWRFTCKHRTTDNSISS